MVVQFRFFNMVFGVYVRKNIDVKDEDFFDKIRGRVVFSSYNLNGSVLFPHLHIIEFRKKVRKFLS